MISPATSPDLFAISGSTVTAPKKELDKDAFLTLLVTQLKNQDPLSPLQPHEFAAQLAQFSSVEQLQTLNDNVLQQTAASHLAALVSQTSLAASLVGRQIVSVGDQVSIPSTGHGAVRVEIGGAGGVATLKLKDANGAVIATRDMGKLGPGQQTLQLPSDLPPGDWHYELSVKGAQDSDVDVTTYTTGVVSAIQFKNGTIMLRIGSIDVSLDDLVQIEPAGTPANPTTGNPPAAGDPANGVPEQPPTLDPTDRLLRSLRR
jgi:flagellar basal-body rod modification protein FlgD